MSRNFMTHAASCEGARMGMRILFFPSFASIRSYQINAIFNHNLAVSFLLARLFSVLL